MSEPKELIEQIQAAFGANKFPGAGFLQGSFDGDEPYDEVEPFRERQEWQLIESDFLDLHAAALSFFSEAGFRFFLPAYLVADLNGQLERADPLFHLTHGFYDHSFEIPAGGQIFTRNIGGSELINPRRYGAARMQDYYRYRMSIFTREESAAIVAYLEVKRDHDPGNDRARIDAALAAFWLERARSAPTAADLARYLEDQENFIAARRSKTQDQDGKGGTAAFHE